MTLDLRDALDPRLADFVDSMNQIGERARTEGGPLEFLVGTAFALGFEAALEFAKLHPSDARRFADALREWRSPEAGSKLDLRPYYEKLRSD